MLFDLTEAGNDNILSLYTMPLNSIDNHEVDNILK